jgi:hypothetical protein
VALPAPKKRQGTRAIASKQETPFELVPFVPNDDGGPAQRMEDNYRVAKAPFGPDSARSGRENRAVDAGHEKRMTKFQEARQPASAAIINFPLSLTTGMFGSAAEII